MKNKFLLLMLAFVGMLTTHAQTPPDIQWQRSFGGTGSDYLNSLQQTSDGGYILGGYSDSGVSGNKTNAGFGFSDYWVVKLDSNGGQQWDKSFGGSDHDILQSLQQTGDGGYILGGYSLSGTSGNKTNDSFGAADYWVVKTDAGGNREWDLPYGGSGDDILQSLQQTSDGGYILGGHSFSGVSGNKTNAGFGDADYWVVKLAASGIKQWDKSFGGSGYDRLYSLQQASDGGYLLGGQSASDVSGNKTNAGFGSHDYWVVKLDADGNKQWDKSFGGADFDVLFSLQQTSDGGYILGGFSNSGVSGNKTNAGFGFVDYWVVKLDSNGGKQWDKTFGGSGNDGIFTLQQTSDGGYILGGYSDSDVLSGNRTNAGYVAHDYWVVKLDPNGNKQWDQSYGGSDYDELQSLQQTSDGGYILGGYTPSPMSGNKTSDTFGSFDYWVVKLGITGPPVIVVQPQSQTVFLASNVVLSVVAGGTTPLFYQWQKGGTNLASQTNTTLTLTNFQTTDAGTYSVGVSNALDAVTSSNALVLLNSPLRFTSFSSGSNHLFLALLAGIAGTNYIFQASTNLTNWASLLTNNAGNGFVNFSDTNAPGFPARFYRAQQQP